MIQPRVLPSRLRLLCKNMDGTQSVTALVLVGAGSRYETKDINGISHFLEHMFFKGAKIYKDTRAVSEAIDGVGGEFNAFTGKEYAGYYVKVAAQHLDMALEVLADMMKDATFPAEEIEKERGVIMEELNMYQDTPMYQAGWNFEQLMYGDQPIGWDQVGTKELIMGVTREQFQTYKKKLYTPDNTVIAVVGNVDEDAVAAKVEKLFGEYGGEKKDTYAALDRALMTERLHVQDKKTEQAHLVLGVESFPENHPDRYTAKVLATMLGGNMSSRMFLNVRDAKGLCYYIGTSEEEFLDTGTFSTRAGVTVEKVEEAISSIIAEYDSFLADGFQDEELVKSKEYMKGKLVLGLEDSEEMAYLLAKQELIEGKVRTIEEIMADIDAVTRADVERVAKELLQKDRYRLAIIGPYGKGEQFQKYLG